MFLKQTRLKNGRTHLAIVASYKDGGRTRQRTVESLGYLDELEEHIEDPVAHFRGVCEEMNEAARRASEPVTIEIHPLERVRVSESPGSRRNVGCAVPLAHYGSLGIEGVLRNHARGRRFSYDPNAVARLLVCERILSPDSKLAAWNSRDRYFFRTDFSDDDVYRCLDFLSECRDPVVSAMNRSIAARGVRDTSNFFYDVTNYYFEVDGEDELRRRGVSKEHRPDPIVQMGLLQDADGIPISYRLFPGNTVDCLTMIPVLSDMKRDLGLGRVVAVADKGLNCSDNIAALVARGDGFVFSQSIRGTKSRRALRDWVISDEGYAASGDGFRIKSRQDIKTVHVTSPEADRETKVDVDVDVKVVAFWSRKHRLAGASRPRDGARQGPRDSAQPLLLRRRDVLRSDEVPEERHLRPRDRGGRRGTGTRDRARRGAHRRGGGLRWVLLHRHERDRDVRRRDRRHLPGAVAHRGVLQDHQVRARGQARLRLDARPHRGPLPHMLRRAHDHAPDAEGPGARGER